MPFRFEKNINFISMRYAAFAVSLLILAVSIISLSSRGLSLGIDFTGGTLIEIQLIEAPDLGEMRNELNSLQLGEISIQEFGTPEDLLIRLPQQAGDNEAQQAAIEQIRGAIDEAYPSVDYRRVEYVGPQIGEELKQRGLMAILFALGGILVYIAFRFEWRFGVAAIAALVHDSIATIGLFSVTQIEFNLSTVAAILMIAGYSINDTVVVFDRIRENLRKYKKMPLPDLLNQAVTQTLSRTIMTSLTTLLALIALWLFGGEVIRGFVNALIFGILIGTYSSIFIAAPILSFMKLRRYTDKELEEAKSENATA